MLLSHMTAAAPSTGWTICGAILSQMGGKRGQAETMGTETMTDQERHFTELELEEAKEAEEGMGITLYEYLLLRILRELQQIPYKL